MDCDDILPLYNRGMLLTRPGLQEAVMGERVHIPIPISAVSATCQGRVLLKATALCGRRESRRQTLGAWPSH